MRAVIKVAVGIGLLFAATGAASAWSEQNCRMFCARTASPARVLDCQTRNGGCARFAGGTHAPMSVVDRRVAVWKERSRFRMNALAGSMYEGKMSGGRTLRNRRGSCSARVHSAGWC